MTKVIHSMTHDTQYFLTIDEQGNPTGCSCPDYHYRRAAYGASCKHMRAYRDELTKAETFLALKAHFQAEEAAESMAAFGEFIFSYICVAMTQPHHIRIEW